MAKKHIIKGFNADTIEIATNGHEWIVGKNASISSNEESLDVEGDNNKITIAGSVWSEDPAIEMSGTGNKVVITATGVMSGNDDAAVAFNAEHNEVTNFGRIVSDEIGVDFDAGFGNRFTNNGFVSADIGISYINIAIATEQNVAINKASGRIYGDSSAVETDMVAGDKFKFVNFGNVVGDDDAYVGSLGMDIVINKGKMIGNVSLGDGFDTFDGRGGKLNGVLNGGDGDDTLFTDNKNLVLVELTGEGYDTVKSTVSYTLTAFVDKLLLLGKTNINGTGTDDAEWLQGNAGKNTLNGLGGGDLLDGAAGNDKIKSGLGDDDIYFGTGYDTDIVLDFENGADQVNLAKWDAISSFTDLLNNHTDFVDGDVIMTAGKDKLIIRNLSEAQFDTTDVSFILV